MVERTKPVHVKSQLIWVDPILPNFDSKLDSNASNPFLYRSFHFFNIFIIFFDQIRLFSGSGSGSTKRSAVIVLRGHGNMGKTAEAGTGGTGATKWQWFHSLCPLISHRFSSFFDPTLIQLFCASIAYTTILANLCPGKSGKSLQAYRLYIYWYVAYDSPTRFTHHTAPPFFAQILFLFPFLVRAWWRHWAVGWWYADWWEFASSKAWPILGFRPFQMLHLVKQIILSLLPDGFKINLNSITRNLEPLMSHSKVSLPWWCHLAPAPNKLCGSECKARWSLPSAVTKWNLHLHRNCES